MMRLKGKVALITGCNRGIGKSIMETFMAEGADIVACTRQMTPELGMYYQQKEIEYAVKIYPLLLDLADEEKIKSAMRELYSWKLTIDILVNNAGIASFVGIMRLKLSEVKNIFQVNYFSSLLMIQYLIKLMLRSNSASIINIASVAALDGMMGNCAYGASKASVILMTKSLSKELGNSHIRVNAIAPGYIDTDMQTLISPELSDNFLNGAAIKRRGAPEEVANVALFLASDESSYITGQIIRVDGGL